MYKELSPTDPQISNPTVDHQEWCLNIDRWFETIAQAAEKGEDRMEKQILATLVNKLNYRRLHMSQDRL